MIAAGVSAPEFKLLGSDGDEHSLSDFLGKWVVLYFYPKDNTSGCTKEACDFTDAIEGFVTLNAVILGISPDNATWVKLHIWQESPIDYATL